jgi:hypothetical protein
MNHPLNKHGWYKPKVYGIGFSSKKDTCWKKILMIEWASFCMQEQNRSPTIHWLFPSASPGAFWKPLSSREAPNSFSVDSN